MTRASASVDFGKLPVGNNPGAKAGNNNGQSVTINNIDTSVIEKAVASTSQKWNLVQHTDKNGVTHIEVESTQLPAHLVKRGGGGGVGGGGGIPTHTRPPPVRQHSNGHQRPGPVRGHSSKQL